MLKIPESRLLQFLIFFATQFLSYFLFVASTRAVAMGSYSWTCVTDTLFAMQAFLVAKVMVDNKEARGLWAGAGYTLGGTFGSLFSIFVTKQLYGH